MISAGVNMNCSLMLEPAYQLTFWLDPRDSNAPVRATLKLSNISATKPVVFKVRTNNANMFTVKPVHGVIPPGDAVDVAISVVPSAVVHLAAIDPRTLAARDSERFLIQSVERAEDMRGADLNDLVAFWKRVPRELSVNSKVGCRFAMSRSGIDPSVHAVATTRCLDDKLAAGPQQCIDIEQIHDLRRHASPSSPCGIDRTIDLRDAERQRDSSLAESAMAMRPSAFESSSSSESDVSAGPDDDDDDSTTAAATTTTATGRTKALFSIHPHETLAFKVQAARADRAARLLPASFFVTNKARTHALAFKVKTTNHGGYYVKPSRGLIGPSNAQCIQVVPVKDTTMAIDTARDLQQREANDRFLVEIVRVDMANYQELLSLDERVRKRELFSLWDRADSGVREKAVLSCRISGLEPSGQSAPHHQQQQQQRVRPLPAGRGNNIERRSGSFKHVPPAPHDDEFDMWC